MVPQVAALAVTFYNRERMRNPPAGVYVIEMAFESLTGNVLGCPGPRAVGLAR